MVIDLLTQSEASSLIDGIRWVQGATLNPAMSSVKVNEESPHVPQWVTERLFDSIPFAFPKVVLPMRFNRYRIGAHYSAHADSPFMDLASGMRVRTDLSCTLFLTDDYEGGELCFNGLQFKGKVGQAIVYPADTIHQVMPVTRGERICAITWIESEVKDREQREALDVLRRTIGELKEFSPIQTELAAVYGRLLRKWLE